MPLLACPNCNKSGFLIKHSKIYRKLNNQTHFHGQRIYCSNRANKQGCGKTFALNLSILLPNKQKSTNSISIFFKNYLEGSTIIKSWVKAELTGDHKEPHRILKSVKNHIHILKPFLMQLKKPPDLKSNQSVTKNLIKHICTTYQSDNFIASLLLSIQSKPF